MAHIRSQLVCLLAMAALGCPTVFAAKISPPTETLFSGGVLIEATWLRAEPDGSAFFVRVERCISGCNSDAKGELRIAAEPVITEFGQPLQQYYINYNEAEKRFNTAPKVGARDVANARLMSVEGAQPALFLVSPQTRLLFAQKPKPPKLAQVLQQLSNPDPQLADLWSAELVYRESYLSQIDPSVLARIEKAVLDPALMVVSRSRLLGWMANHAPEHALKISADIIKSAPMVPGNTSPEAGLVVNAFTLIQAEPKKLTLADYRRWLGADQLSIAEAAALCIRGVNPKAEKAEIEQLLQRTLLTPVQREFFKDHLRRLALLTKT